MSRQQIGIAVAVEIKLDRRAQGRLDAVGGEDLAGQLIERLVVRKAVAQILEPLVVGNRPLAPGQTALAATLHEHRVECVGHVPRELRPRE